MDLIVRNARLRMATATTLGVSSQPIDIGIVEGRLAWVGQPRPGSGGTDRTPRTGDTNQAAAETDVQGPSPEIDAAGGLVTESFVDAHLHLDKVFTAATIGDQALTAYHQEGMTGAGAAIDAAASVKLSQDPKTMLDGGRRALAMAGYYGTTHIRALADVDSKAGLRGVETLCALRSEFANDIDLQVVAFAQDGIVREPGTAELLVEAMELGADVVGGIPWIEADEAAMAHHCDTIFDVAEAFDAPVSMLLDDVGNPDLRTLEMMARRMIDRGWHGRALAHHARAMSLYPDAYFAELVPLLVEAQVAVVSDPHTGPLHARVKELLAAGITVCLGQDDISDAYYAFGRENMLEVAFLAAHLLWAMDAAGQEIVYDAVTTSAADAIGLPRHRLEIGVVADLVVLPVSDTNEALRFHPSPSAVIRGGRVLDRDRFRALAAVPD